MVGPWKEVRRQAVRLERNDADALLSRLNALPERLRLETWLDGPIHRPTRNWIDENEIQPDGSRLPVRRLPVARDPTLVDRVMAAFFLAVTVEFAVPKVAVAKGAVAKEARRWRVGAELCLEATQSPHRGALDPALAKALHIARDYFESHARFTEDASAGPFLIGRGARKDGRHKGDDAARGYVRAIGGHLRAIFGKSLHGTLATTISVLVGRNVSSKDVEGWLKEDRTGALPN